MLTEYEITLTLARFGINFGNEKFVLTDPLPVEVPEAGFSALVYNFSLIDDYRLSVGWAIMRGSDSDLVRRALKNKLVSEVILKLLSGSTLEELGIYKEDKKWKP